MIMCLGSGVFADEGVPTDLCPEYDGTDTLNSEDYSEANAALIERGRMAQLLRAEKTLNVPHYYQNGQVWSNDIMQSCNQTIGSSGCTLTSFAMIQGFFGGSLNPRGVNDVMKNYACPFEYTVAASRFGYSIKNYKDYQVSNPEAIDFIIGAIDSGLPVLVGMKKSDGGTHFVTAYGYGGRSIYIRDPGSNRDYSLLESYLVNYTVRQLYVYQN